MKIKKITIKRYRSINNLTLNINSDSPLIICGSNNVGKTNFLRALKLFFEFDKNNFNTKTDIPYDIEEGSRGARRNTIITVEFNEESDLYEISITFKNEIYIGNTFNIKAKKNNTPIAEKEAKDIIKKYRFILMEASNINIPQIIDTIIDNEVLPLALDRQRSHQTKPLRKLKEFIEESKLSVETIEIEIGRILSDFIVNVPGINGDNWKIKILFPKYEKLREALSGLIDFTLHDGNDRKMEAKGSGIQRTILLSLIKYISEKSNKKIIWGIDEPEAFLQPTLQKKTFTVISDLSKKQNVFLTTHSQYFIDISNLKNTYLFEANYEEKEYVRRKGETFYKVSTFVNSNVSDFEKTQNIKEHLGMQRNDNWEIMPFNLLVEGEEDKNYITAIIKKFNLKIPNIFVSGGVGKIKGYLQFLEDYCKDIKFKPKIVCLLDNDRAGKDEFNTISDAIKKGKYKYFNLELKKISRFDGEKDDTYDNEIEDLIYPDIINKTMNKIIANKGYAKITQKKLKERTRNAYDKNCVLKFFTDITKISNSKKPPIEFESESIKKYMCIEACKLIASSNIESINRVYPHVKKFIEEIAK